MASLCELFASGIIEKDTSGDVLWTWSYPTVSTEQREFLLSKSGLGAENQFQLSFLYGQWKDVWYYIKIEDLSKEQTTLTKVSQLALILLCKDFNPEKYFSLCEMFTRQYKKTGNAAFLLEAYLSVVTRGTCNNDDNGKFSITDFSPQQAYANCCIKEIIQTFGVETILIYTAMMLKKRIAVYSPPHSLDKLLQYTRSIPAFSWHRQNWNVVYPYVQLTEAELETLYTSSHFVAGFTEADVEGRSDLYDLFVNVPNGQITVASHAKESLAMGRLHKEIAMLMVEKADDDTLDNLEVIRAIADKTKDLLNNLRSLATEGDNGKFSLTLETLKERKMPPATENFLFNLAASEGFVKL